MSSDPRLLEGLELISRGIAMMNSEVPSRLQENRGQYTSLQSSLNQTLRRLDALEERGQKQAEELQALQRSFNRILTEFIPKVDNLLVQLNGDPNTSEKCREDMQSVQIGNASVVNKQNPKLKNTMVQEEIVSISHKSQTISVEEREDQKKKNRDLFNLANSGVHWEIPDAIERGAEINGVTNKGKTALMLAVMNGHVRCVVALIQYGANIFQKDDEGKTAKSHALIKKRDNLVEMFSLLEHEVREGYSPDCAIDEVIWEMGERLL